MHKPDIKQSSFSDQVLLHKIFGNKEKPKINRFMIRHLGKNIKGKFVSIVRDLKSGGHIYKTKGHLTRQSAYEDASEWLDKNYPLWRQ